MHDEYGELHLPADQHRLWSPHLSFYVESRGGQTVVHGRFAPRLTVWTSVWIAYLFLAFTAFFALMLGGVQLGIGLPPWGLAVGSLAALLILGLYMVAHIGQQWSVDQMHQLRDRLIDLLQQDSGSV
jgi:hypothetical protein